MVCRLHRVTLVDLLHYPFRPPNRVGDGTHRRRNSRPTVVLRQLAGREDAGGDQQHALATFVHRISVAYSLFVRYTSYTRVGAGIHSQNRDAEHNPRRRIEGCKAADGFEQRVASVHPLGN